MAPVRILLTATAFDRFGDRLPPGVEPVVMEDDGTLRTGDPWEDAAVEVAWPTADLFDPDAPLRPFFGFLLQSTTLRWIQSPAAGVDAPVFAQLVRNGIRLDDQPRHRHPDQRVRAAGGARPLPTPAGVGASSSADKDWRRHDFREVHGTTWLVVGLGAIGASTAVQGPRLRGAVIGVRRTPRGDEPVDRMVTPDAGAATCSATPTSSCWRRRRRPTPAISSTARSWRR